MALVLNDRVQETTTTTGTGAVTLLGAVTGYQTFAVVGNGNTCYYTIADQGGANWEVGIGTYSTTGPSLARNTVLSSSNAGSLVDFTAGIKTVFVTYPSEKSVNLDASGNVSPLGTVASGTWQGTAVGIGYGGTGQTTASAAFNALSPITTAGDLIIGNGANSATRLAIGTNGQILTSDGTTASWVDPATGGGTVTTTDFTATSGQTTFTVNYTVGATEVYQNGIKLGQADYTATNGTSIILATGATAGDLIEVVSFSNLNLYATITYEDFSGDGTTTVFTMSAVPANSASLLVAISGVVQDPGTYTVSSTTLTFLTAPPSGSSNISVRYLGVASVGTVGSFSGGTTGLTPSSATTGAVVLGGTLNVANGGTGATSLAGANIAVTNATNTFTADQSISGLTVGKGGGSVSSNTAVGYQTLYSNTALGQNLAVGYQAGYSLTGSGNLGDSYIGYQAGYSKTATNDTFGTVFLGYKTGYSVTSGVDNTGFGNNVFQDTTSGSYNVGIGGGALRSNTTASNNTAVGYQAGYSGTTAQYNTFVGNQAGYGITTGSRNTFVGAWNSGSQGSGRAITTGSANTIIGAYDGNSGGLDIRTASNYIVLSDGDGNPRGVFDSSGNLLVGTVSAVQVDSGTADGATFYGPSSAFPNRCDMSRNGAQALNLRRRSSDGLIQTFSRDTSNVGNISVTTTATAYNTSSDYRLKNITGEVTNAKDFIMALKPKQGTWKADGSKFVGFLAHEFQEVSPSSVTGEKDAVDVDGKPIYQSMQASSPEVMANLIALVQQLTAEVDSLKQQLEAK